MKKTCALILVVLLMIPLLSGCGGRKEPPAIRYTSEILINKEAPAEDLVWYIRLHGPSSNRGIIPIPSYSTNAILGTTEILQTDGYSYRDILDAKAPYQDTFWEKVGFFFSRKLEEQKHNYKLKIFGMTSEEYAQKVCRSMDCLNVFGEFDEFHDFNYYQDRVIGISYPHIYQGETEELTSAEYSNKNILVDYDYETSVVIPYTDEELIEEGGGRYSTSYVGRVGDRYYLPYGYYDLTTRTLCPYKDENDLPPFKDSLGIKDQYDLREVIINNAEVAESIPFYWFIDSYAFLGDRYYAVIGEGNIFYENSIDDYEGSDVFFVTVDVTTGEVLYLQKFHFENYWGYEYKLYSLGEDGLFYDVMVP